VAKVFGQSLSGGTNSNDGFVLTDDYNVSQCTAYSSGHNGFTLGKHGQIRDCTAYTNSATGISALVFAQVKGCFRRCNITALSWPMIQSWWTIKPVTMATPDHQLRLRAAP